MSQNVQHGENMAKHQSGAALVVGLIMLLLLTIIGLSAMQGTTLQEKMSGNMRDTTMAMQAADVALRYVEVGFLGEMNSLDIGKTFSACSGNCLIVDSEGSTAAATALTSNFTAWENEATTYGQFAHPVTGVTIAPPAGSTITTAPQLLVEYVYFSPDDINEGSGTKAGIDFYRVTAVASGGTTNSQATAQSVFGRRF